MKKYPKIRSLGHPETEGILKEGTLYVHEKLDGANFRFTYDEEENRILFGSRNVVWKNEKDIANAFEHAVEHVRGAVNKDALDSSRIYYGEAMHKHTLEYDWDNTPSFIGFDVYSSKVDRFYTAPMGREEFKRLGLEPAPLVHKHLSVEEFRDLYVEDGEVLRDELVPESEYRDGKAEGVVIKNTRVFEGFVERKQAKVRTEEFLEKNKEVFGDDGGGKKELTDVEKMVEAVITKSRVEKHAHKMVDEGDWDGVQMEMMGDGLPMAVITDALEEEAHEIVTQNWTIDMGDFRSTASSKVAEHLREVMTANV